MNRSVPSACPVCPMLLCGDVYHTLNANRALLFQWIPELSPTVGFPQNNPYHSRTLWDHTIYAVSQVPADLVLRMTMLLHDLGKLTTRTTDARGVDHFYGHDEKSAEAAEKILHRLGIDPTMADEIKTLIALHDVDLFDSPKTIRRLCAAYPAPLRQKLLLVKRADILAQSPERLGQRITQLASIRAAFCADA